MIVGYARVSTNDQDLSVQIDQLEDVGVEKIFSEKKSGVDDKRPQLAVCLDFVRQGDTLVVSKLDRLARSTKHLLEIVDDLQKRGVSFKVLNINLDTNTPTGKLMLTMLGAVADFERELMLERQREGIAKAKAKGRYKGRKPTARAKADQIVRMDKDGISKPEIAERLEIGIASVYRILNEHKTTQQQNPEKI